MKPFEGMLVVGVEQAAAARMIKIERVAMTRRPKAKFVYCLGQLQPPLDCTMQDLSQHAGLCSRNVTTSEGATLTIPAPPIRWANQAKSVTKNAPCIGRDTKRVLAEFSAEN